jgi:UDP-N-acetylmuramate dehydrogenase
MTFVPDEFVPLAPLTTMGVGGTARFFRDVRDENELAAGLAWARQRGVPSRPLGGGSNVVVADGGFDGLVLRLASRGVAFEPADGSLVTVTASAGEPWDELVAECVRRELQGFECLSGIPGQAGATPIQNVGAYGQDVAETILGVRVLDRVTLATRELAPADCRFAYRDSALKSEMPERYVVTAVRFRLRRGGTPALRYAELTRHFEAEGTKKPTLAAVREAVLRLRRAKSMVLDPSDENGRSCGSFFTNPIVTAEAAAEVVRRAGEAAVPRFAESDGRVKLAAAWLIENAGFPKGTRRGAVGLSTRHALAIVSHPGARASDVLAFAASIQAAVRERFGISLTPEPALWGPALS